MRGFREVVQDCNLFDIPIEGYPFKLSRSMGTEAMVEERLDKALASPLWGALFPEAGLLNLVAPISDQLTDFAGY